MRRFILTLAWQAGRIADVDRFASEMGSEQLAEWLAFDRIAPLGDERHDYLGAMNAWAAAGFAGKISDYLIFKPKPKPTKEQESLRIRAGFAAISAAFPIEKGK